MADKTQQQIEHEAASEAGRVRHWDEEVLTALMNTPQGRFWVERLLDLCGVGRPLYLDDGDALGMAKRDGRADIGRYLETQLQEYVPDQFVRMIRERRTRMERDAEKQKAAEANTPTIPKDGSWVDKLAEEADRNDK
jgi:hypothetical protein